jgi:hypothetical protein
MRPMVHYRRFGAGINLRNGVFDVEMLHKILAQEGVIDIGCS